MNNEVQSDPVTEAASQSTSASRWTDGSMQSLVRKRYAAERRFKMFGLVAVGLSVAFLAFLLITMAAKGLGGFTQSQIRIDVDFAKSDVMLDPAALKGADAAEIVAGAGLDGVLEQTAVASYGEGAGELFGGASARSLSEQLIADPTLLERRASLWLPLSSKGDVAAKRDGDPEIEKMVEAARDKGAIRTRFNSGFLTASDATDSSSVGVWGALKGSFLTIMVTMLLAFPIGVLSAVYLEEFAPRNRWTDMIEV